MSTSIETPIKTPQSSKQLTSENMLSTPLFVPPTPMLKELGYGTGECSNNFICIEDLHLLILILYGIL